MSAHPVLIDGKWIPADSTATFQATNPATKEIIEGEYPVSSWSDCEKAIAAAATAATEMRGLSGEQIAAFLEEFANQIEQRKDELVAMANAETALPASPRLADGELPRTTGQLRQAAAAARTGSWRNATIDTANDIRSVLAPIGPVCVFGPNNFPFAFGSISGGDFAAAIAAGNPVIGKANSSHPGTTRIFGEAVLAAINATGMPRATVQLIYRTGHSDGERLVADPRVGATGYTGSRSAGLKLKAAADAAGNPIYLELSSVNPVVILPGALEEREDDIVAEFKTSGLMGTGQFCTNPGVVLMLKGDRTESFIEKSVAEFANAAPGTLLSAGVQKSLTAAVAELKSHGATSLVGDGAAADNGFSCANTLLRISGDQFLANPTGFQEEAFGNCSMFVVADSVDQLSDVIDELEGNLTGCVYSHTGGSDDDAANLLSDHLRTKVGRLLNDKMPTGVAVSAAMNHGGPFPATGHPGFTAVGIPASIPRFAALQCYDGVRSDRLPECLQNKNPNGVMWRSIDGNWTQGDVA